MQIGIVRFDIEERKISHTVREIKLNTEMKMTTLKISRSVLYFIINIKTIARGSDMTRTMSLEIRSLRNTHPRRHTD